MKHPLRRAFPLALAGLAASACIVVVEKDDHDHAPRRTASVETDAVQAAPASAPRTYDKPGFATDVVDGRLWIFVEESDALAEYRELGEPAKHVIRPGIGPDGMTVKAPDNATIQAYMAAAEGFETFVVDGRVWVFAEGDPALEEFHAVGEPAEHVVRPGAGPLGMTVKAPDPETIDAYLRVVGKANPRG